jgi:BlaI family transcriptional regulator, penicillinase repressor
MAKRPEMNLTSIQLQIMNLFWDQGELGVAQVWKLLQLQRPLARNTVQTMLARLADKGWLRTRADGNAFYYRAARPRDSVVRGMLGKLLDTAFAGSAAGLVMTLLENRRISAEEAERIRQLIDRAQREE